MLKINKEHEILIIPMSRPKILYASSSVGLGHVTRDIHLSKYLNWGDISWLSAGQALKYLESRNLEILDTSYRLTDLGKTLKHLAENGSIKMTLGGGKRVYDTIKSNAEKIAEEVDLYSYDLLIADEFWELLFQGYLDIPSVFITDFIRFKSIGRNIIGKIILPLVNREIYRRMMRFSIRIFIGFKWEGDDAFEYYGQVYTHDEDAETFDGGYILVNIGGTDIGRTILDAVLPVLTQLNIEYKVIGGTTLFKSNPVKDIAGASLVISLGGYGSLLEIARYRKRGVIIPLGNHFEQIDNSRIFIGRRGYRVIPYEKLNRDILLNSIRAILAEEPDPPEFRDASKEIAMRIRMLLNK